MLRRILIVVLTGGVPLLLLHWNERPGHHVPNWLLYISALPFLWVAMSDEEYWEDDESALGRFFSGFATLYAFSASAFLVFVGIVGLAMKNAGLGELLVFALPVGFIGLIAAFVSLWFKAR